MILLEKSILCKKEHHEQLKKVNGNFHWILYKIRSSADIWDISVQSLRHER